MRGQFMLYRFPSDDVAAGKVARRVVRGRFWRCAMLALRRALQTAGPDVEVPPVPPVSQLRDMSWDEVTAIADQVEEATRDRKRDDVVRIGPGPGAEVVMDSCRRWRRE